MIGHVGPISGIASHSDRLIATAGYDNQVILWDQRTRTAMARVMHDHLANQCAFSPAGDLLVTSSSDYTARLWSVPDLSLVTVLGDHTDDVEMSVFHPDRPLVATASRDHQVRVFETNGKLRHRFTGHTADVISVEWASGGDELITSSDDGTVKRWSLLTEKLVEDIDLGGAETDTVVIDSDGTLYAGNDLGQIIVISAAETSRIAAHDAGIKRLVLSSERGLLVSLSYDRALRLWDVSETRPQPLLHTTFPDDVWPRSCAFAAGSTLVCGTFGRVYRTFDYDRGHWREEPVPITHGVNAATEHDSAVLSIGDAGELRRDGTPIAGMDSLCNFLTPVPGTSLVLTGGQLGTVFDALTERVLYQHHSPVNCAVAYDVDGDTHVVIGAYTGEGIIIRIGTDSTTVHVCDVPLHENAVKGIAVQDGVIFSVSADQGAAWHDARTLHELHRVNDAHDRIANACVGVGSGWFASVGRDRVLRLWDPSYKDHPEPTPLSHSVKCVAADERGTVVAVGTYDGHVAFYDRSEKRWTQVVRPSASGISSITRSADGGFVASSYDGLVHRIEVTP
ncbi:WD40 repeat domain-containing protein [Actinopolyspora halophila]|uniref:WD40 repeat domain-containing protein n=1 Tax=Actinopolyspora halophila TaxID=1850 RepID=UPI0003A5A89B|nr:WD40 repeat domain-containing protein [Actinopolyspora halophila]